MQLVYATPLFTRGILIKLVQGRHYKICGRTSLQACTGKTLSWTLAPVPVSQVMVKKVLSHLKLYRVNIYISHNKTTKATDYILQFVMRQDADPMEKNLSKHLHVSYSAILVTDTCVIYQIACFEP